MRSSILLACAVSSLLLFSACTPARSRSLVDDLRLIAAAVEAPEVAPGDTVAITFEVADAGQTSPRPLETLFVACSLLPGYSECLEAGDLARDPENVTEEGTLTEAGYQAYFDRFVQRGQAQAGRLELTLNTAFSAAFLLGGGPPGAEPPADAPTSTSLTEVTGGVSMLVCAAGACDDFLAEVDAYRAGDPSLYTGAELLSLLTTGDILLDLPFEDVARATKSYLFSLRDPADRNHNPEPQALQITEQTTENAPGAGGGRPGFEAVGKKYTLELTLPAEALELTTEVLEDGSEEVRPERLTVHWFSTAGDISPQRQPLEDLSQPIQSTLTATADEMATGFTLYASVTDDRYGSGWRTYVVKQEGETVVVTQDPAE